MVHDGSLGKILKFLISVRVCQPGQPETFCIVLNCCCILAVTGLPLDCCLLCNRRLGICISSYVFTLARQLCTERNYTFLAIEVRVCGPSPTLRCLSMARASKSISPKGTTRNHAFLENWIEKARCEIFQLLWEETIVDDQKPARPKAPPPQPPMETWIETCAWLNHV